MANITTNWTTVATRNEVIDNATVTFIIEAKYVDQNSFDYTTWGFQVRLRSETSGAPVTTSFSAECSYCDRKFELIWPYRNEVILLSEKNIIQQNANASKSITLTAKIKGNNIDISFNGTAILPAIQRYANMIEANNFNDEEEPLIKFNNANNYRISPFLSFINENKQEYTIRRSPSSTFIDYGNNNYGYLWQFTDSNLTNIRSFCNSSTTYDVKMGIEIIGNGAVIGLSYKINTFTIINGQPSISLTVQEQNTNIVNYYGQSSNYIINNASIIKNIIIPTVKKEATVKKVTSKINAGIAQQDSGSIESPSGPYEFTFNIVNYPTNANIYIDGTVQDSRNLSNAQSTHKTILDYLAVENKSIQITRTENLLESKFYLNAGQGTDAGITYYQTTFTGSDDGLGNEVVNEPLLQWQVEGENTWHTIPYIKSGAGTEEEEHNYEIDTDNNKIVITNYVLDTKNVSSIEIPYYESGTIKIKVSDKLTQDIDGYIITSSTPTFDAGATDLNINGELYISDRNGYNRVEYTPFRAGTQQEPSTYTFPSRLCIGGLLTSSKSNIFATIFLPRPIQAGVKPTITGGEFVLRGMGRYIEGTDSTPIDASNLSNMQIVANTYGDNQIEIQIHKGANLSTNVAFTSQDTMNNNTPVAVMVSGLEITFVTPS